jgi:pimeloyl-ACP methyl ester carboxylesterase
MFAGGVYMLDMMKPLARFGPVVVPDLPGCVITGVTETPSSAAARVPANARFLRAFLARLGVRDVVLHGWSMGSVIALRYAAGRVVHGDDGVRLRGLVLATPPLPVPLSAAGRLAWGTLGRLACDVFPPLAHAAATLMTPRLATAVIDHLERRRHWFPVVNDVEGISDETIAWWFDFYRAACAHPRVYAYAADALASIGRSMYVDQRDLLQAMMAVREPVLLYSGATDPLISQASIDQALRMRPDWFSHVVHDAGHGIPAQRPEEYAEVVGRWLADNVMGAVRRDSAGVSSGHRWM